MIECTGRRTGRTYTTPIRVMEQFDDDVGRTRSLVRSPGERSAPSGLS